MMRVNRGLMLSNMACDVTKTQSAANLYLLLGWQAGIRSCFAKKIDIKNCKIDENLEVQAIRKAIIRANTCKSYLINSPFTTRLRFESSVFWLVV